MSWTPSPAEYADVELALDGILTTVDLTLPDEAVATATSAPAPGASASGAPASGAPASGAPAAGTVPQPDPAPGRGGPRGTVEITDPEGTPVAAYDPAGRTVTPLRPREHGLFQHLRRTPAQFQAEYAGQKVAAVPVSAPLDTHSVQRLAGATRAYDMTVLLALIGPGSPELVSATGLLRATLAAADLLPGVVRVVPVPMARREDPDADVRLRARIATAYGQVIDVAPDPDQLAVIGDALDRGRTVEPELVPEPIATVLRADRPPLAERGLVVFFTGLSGSGKSTVAQRLRDVLLERTNRTITLLDGDVVRRMLSKGLGFSKADREANIRRIGFVAAEIARHGGLAICAPIAPYASTRAEVRRFVTDAGGTFALIHVATPLAECERRDRKGLYAKARRGEIAEFTGISDPYEEPTDADLAIDTTGRDIDDVVDEVFALLTSHGWISPRQT